MELINFAIKKNTELHKEFASKYKFIGSGMFLNAYYDELNNCVYKVFKLSFLKNKVHSKLVSNKEELISKIISNILNEKKEKKKIKLLISNIWKNNHDWPLFCLKKNNKYNHIPKVYDIKYHPENFSFSYTVEKLISINSFSKNKLDYTFISGIADCFNCSHTYPERSFLDYFSPDYFSMTQDSYIKRLKYVNIKELKKLSKEMKNNFSQYEIDLHSRNFMFREKDSLLIINDPLY